MIQRFGPSLFIAQGSPVSFFGMPYPTRMAVAKLGCGSLWVWSPIALTDGLFPERRNQPWLAWWGIALFGLLYLAANAAVASYSYQTSHFMAAPGEFLWSGAVTVALVAAAWRVSRRKRLPAEREAPSPPALFALGFVPGALLTAMMYYGRRALDISAPAAVAAMALLGVVAIAALVVLERRRWSGAQRVALTYNMNILQGLKSRRTFCVTLNRSESIDPKRVLRRLTYDHPLFTPRGIDAQRRHREISGARRTHYCGAYWRYGFHEDGVVSALEAVQLFDQGIHDAKRDLQRVA